MDKRECQWRLLIVWLGGAFVILLIMVAQQMGDAFEDESKVAWGWFATTVLAAPGLLLGAYIAPASGQQRIERRMYLMTLAISLVYLGLVLFTFGWFAFQAKRRLVDILSESTLFLGPVQGLVTLALGRFIGVAATEGS